MDIRIINVDPLGEVALSLLREAVVDARALYPELTPPNAPRPTNYQVAAPGGGQVFLSSKR